MTILAVLLIVSTVLCIFNLWFYVRFWRATPSWGTAIMALFPAVLLTSRALELHRLEAMALGYEYVPNDWVRGAVAVLGIGVCVAQAVAAVVHYNKLLNKVRKTGIKRGE